MSAAVTLAPVVAIYLRVSTGEQHVENQEPDVQKLIATRYPTSKVVTYREKASATKNKRPVFRQMLADAKAGMFHVLVIWKLDRFGRTMLGNQQDVVELDKLGVRLVSVCDSWLDTTGVLRNMLVAQFSGISEMEIDNLRMRTKNGLARVRAAGGVTGSVCFGLKIVRTNDALKTPMPVLDEAELPTLRDMAAMLVGGMALRGIAMRLNAKRAGGRASWDNKRVRATLTDRRLRDLGAWSAETIADVDAALGKVTRAPQTGAAAQVHLASSFVACGACGGGLTVKNASYLCSRCQRGGASACVGIGYRAKAEVERELVSVVRQAITGDVMRQALQVARDMLEAAPDVATEGESVAAALRQAEAEGAHIAQAIKKRGPLESLLDAATANDDQKRALRLRLSRLENAPASLDKRRRLAEIERRLGELEVVLQKGGMAARPAVQAVLNGARLSAVPVIVDGERRWALSGLIPETYLLGFDGSGSPGNSGAQGSGRAPLERD